MGTDELYLAFNSLPDYLKKEVEDFISFLQQKNSPPKKKKLRKFGALKGQIHLSKDFDAPLDDFNEYTVKLSW